MRATRLVSLAAITVGLASAIASGACGEKPDTSRWSISGTVSGAVSQGVTVELGGMKGHIVATTTTDASGHYTFTGLFSWNSYIVLPSLTGYAFIPAFLPVTVEGADIVGQDFTAVRRYMISGTVSGAVSQGVTVTLGGAGSMTTTTDAAGHYVFATLDSGSYTVTPALTGYVFDPAIRSVAVNNADVGGQDFFAAIATARTSFSTGNMTEAGNWHTSTKLPSGKVLVTGGSSGVSDLRSAAMYVP